MSNQIQDADLDAISKMPSQDAQMDYLSQKYPNMKFNVDQRGVNAGGVYLPPPIVTNDQAGFGHGSITIPSWLSPSPAGFVPGQNVGPGKLPAMGSPEQIKQTGTQVLEQGLPMAANMAASSIGGLAGGAIGSLASPAGIVPGAITGAGIGGGAENLLDQYVRSKINKEADFQPNWTSAGINTALSAGGEGLGQLLASILKPAAPTLSSAVGEVLGKKLTTPETVPLGQNQINISRLMQGTPEQEMGELSKVNQPFKETFNKIRATQGETAPLHPEDFISRLKADTSLSQAQLDAISDPKKLYDSIRLMRGYEDLTDDQIQSMLSDPDTYNGILNNLERRFGGSRVSGMSFEDLKALKPRQLTMLQEMAAKRGTVGLLPAEDMNDLIRLSQQTGDIQAAMQRALRFAPETPGYLAPINEAQRGAEMIGRGITQPLIDSLINNGNARSK